MDGVTPEIVKAVGSLPEIAICVLGMVAIVLAMVMFFNAYEKRRRQLESECERLRARVLNESKPRKE